MFWTILPISLEFRDNYLRSTIFFSTSLQFHIEMCTLLHFCMTRRKYCNCKELYWLWKTSLCLRKKKPHNFRKRPACSDYPIFHLTLPHSADSIFSAFFLYRRLNSLVCHLNSQEDFAPVWMTLSGCWCPSQRAHYDLHDANSLSVPLPLTGHHRGWPPCLILLLFQKQLISMSL